MDNRIQQLEQHYIVCGGGETGRHIIDELLGSRKPVVLIEQDEDLVARCSRHDGLFGIAGDATDDANLIAGGVERAAGLIISLPSDKDTLYVTMAARMLNKSLRIISSMTDPKIEPKLIKAGADRVISPNSIGALRIASEMIRPTVVEFLDSTLRASQGNLRIGQIVATANCSLIGKSIAESGLDRKYALLVLGFKEPTQDLVFNPSPAAVLTAGTTLIVMGDRSDIDRAKSDF
jgi:voltage-gated potassium channel